MAGPRGDSPTLALLAAVLLVFGAAAGLFAGRQWRGAAAYARAAPCTSDVFERRCVFDTPATVVSTSTRSLGTQDTHIVVLELRLPRPHPNGRPAHARVIARPDTMPEPLEPGTPVRLRLWRGDPVRITWDGHATGTPDTPANAATETTAHALTLLAAGVALAAIWLGRNGAATAAAAVVLGAYVTSGLPKSFDPRFTEPPYALAAFLVALTGSGVVFLLSRRVAAASRPTPHLARPAGR